MKTLEQAFSERATLFEAVAAEARSALTDFCNRKGFLLAGRAKTIESLRDKLETGRYPDLLSIDDAIAFSIVVDTSGQEAEVRKFLRKAFSVVLIRSGNTLQDERIFDFDMTRVYCKLMDKSGLRVEVDQVVFEVQIRTLLQHAWSKITHPYVYKARIYDPKASRLAAELMAQLESVDRSFARFKTTSRSVKAVSRRDMTASSNLTAMIDSLVADGTIPSEMRPSNGRRLGENIYSAIRFDQRRDINKIGGVIRDFFEEQRGRFPRSISIFQLAIVALHDADLLDRGNGRRARRYYVTDEMITLYPSAASIPNRVIID